MFLWFDSSQDDMAHYNMIKRNWINGLLLYESNGNHFHHNDIVNNYRNGLTVVFANDSIIEYNNKEDKDEYVVEVQFCSAEVTNNWWGRRNGPSGIGPGKEMILILILVMFYMNLGWNGRWRLNYIVSFFALFFNALSIKQ